MNERMNKRRESNQFYKRKRERLMACCNVRAALLMRSNKRPEDVGHCFSILTRCFAYVLFLFFSLSPVAASFCVYIHFFCALFVRLREQFSRFDGVVVPCRHYCVYNIDCLYVEWWLRERASARTLCIHCK